VKLFLKGNEKLIFTVAVSVFSTLVLSIGLSPLMVKAQNETGMSEAVQQQLIDLSAKVKELASNAGLNLTIPQDANLTEALQTISNSDALNNLSQQLSQELSQLGINGSVIQSLQQESGADFGSLVQKLQNLTSNRGA
jgi:hypothetical protein